MKADTSVKFFSYLHSGAPTLNGVAGSLIDVLDACLVNGFGAVTVSSLSVASEVATVTVSTGHDLEMVGVNTGPVISVSGATPASLNDEWRVDTVPSATQFTFRCPGRSDGSATGTISVKRAPAGWEKAFSGTNKAAYRSVGVLEPVRKLFRFDDTLNSTYARLTGYDSMSDIDTGSGALDVVAGGAYVPKSNTAGNATARAWFVAADTRAVHVYTSGPYGGFYAFGRLLSPYAGDTMQSFILGSTSTAMYCPLAVGANWGNVDADYTQIGGDIVVTPRCSSLGGSGRAGSSLLAYPNALNQRMASKIVHAYSTNIRGLIPGLYASLFNASSTALHEGFLFADGDIRDMYSYYGRYDSGNSTCPLIDVKGPWSHWGFS